MVVAGIGGNRRVGIPMSSVTRLEHIPATSVERVGSREVVQYRGAILPLLRLDQHLGSTTDRTSDDLVVIVYTADSRSVAIVVDEIVDIVEGETQVHSDIEDFGLVGSAVIQDRIVEVLDVRAAIMAADPRFFSAGDALDPEDELHLQGAS
jgi:two-component system chemotaxis sensor kinase CheA